VVLLCYEYDIFWYFIDILILHFGGLVGAFSIFGRADTGKPVQILGYISKIEAFLEF